MPERILNRKGIIEMMETFVILFVVFIIIGFGMFMFFKFSASSTKKSAEDVCRMDATQMMQSVLSVPDIQCSISGSTENCVDALKLIAFNGTEKAKELAKGNCPKKVVFKHLYPPIDQKMNATECNANNIANLECGQFTLAVPVSKDIQNKASRQFASPVSLYYPHLNQRGVGKLIVTVYM